MQSRSSKRGMGIGAIVLVMVVVMGSVIYQRGSSSPKFTLEAKHFSTPDLAPKITALEAAASTGTALDKAKLADIYVKQAKLTGDPTWYDKAEVAGKASLQMQPASNPEAKLAIAESLEKRHLFAQSLALAKEVVAENPRSPKALANFATVALALGDLDEASRAADLAATLEPTTPTLTLRALVLNARGRDPEAEFEFRRAIAVEDTGDAPTAASTRTAYAKFLTAKGRYDEAREYVNDALRIVPGQYTSLGVSGDLHVKRGDWENAAKDFSDSFAASPQVGSLRKFSRAKRMLKDVRGADDAMREALNLARREIASGVHAHPLELAYVLTASSDPEQWKEAIQLATDELKVRHNVLPWNALAAVQEKAGHLEAASASINEVLGTGNRNPDYFMLAAKINKRLGYVEKARFYYGAALSEDVNLSEAKEALNELSNQSAEKPVALKKE